MALGTDEDRQYDYVPQIDETLAPITEGGLTGAPAAGPPVLGPEQPFPDSKNLHGPRLVDRVQNFSNAGGLGKLTAESQVPGLVLHTPDAVRRVRDVASTFAPANPGGLGGRVARSINRNVRNAKVAGEAFIDAASRARTAVGSSTVGRGLNKAATVGKGLLGITKAAAVPAGEIVAKRGLASGAARLVGGRATPIVGAVMGAYDTGNFVNQVGRLYAEDFKGRDAMNAAPGRDSATARIHAQRMAEQQGIPNPYAANNPAAPTPQTTFEGQNAMADGSPEQMALAEQGALPEEAPQTTFENQNAMADGSPEQATYAGNTDPKYLGIKELAQITNIPGSPYLQKAAEGEMVRKITEEGRGFILDSLKGRSSTEQRLGLDPNEAELRANKAAGNPAAAGGLGYGRVNGRDFDLADRENPDTQALMASTRPGGYAAVANGLGTDRLNPAQGRADRAQYEAEQRDIRLGYGMKQTGMTDEERTQMVNGKNSLRGTVGQRRAAEQAMADQSQGRVLRGEARAEKALDRKSAETIAGSTEQARLAEAKRIQAQSDLTKNETEKLSMDKETRTQAEYRNRMHVNSDLKLAQMLQKNKYDVAETYVRDELAKLRAKESNKARRSAAQQNADLRGITKLLDTYVKEYQIKADTAPQDELAAIQNNIEYMRSQLDPRVKAAQEQARREEELRKNKLPAQPK